MKIKYSPGFEKSLKKYNKDLRLKTKKKLELFLENKRHPSLRYKKVQALKNENPPVWEISVDKDIRITLQEFDDHMVNISLGKHSTDKDIRITLQEFDDHMVNISLGKHSTPME